MSNDDARAIEKAIYEAVVAALRAMATADLDSGTEIVEHVAQAAAAAARKPLLRATFTVS